MTMNRTSLAPLDYIGQLTFAPNQNKEMEEKIFELHKSHRSERTRPCNTTALPMPSFSLKAVNPVVKGLTV